MLITSSSLLPSTLSASSASPANSLFIEKRSIFMHLRIDLEENEVSRYLQLPEAGQHANPLQWWKDRQLEFPTLSLLAREYLGFCATSVPSERLFFLCRKSNNY